MFHCNNRFFMARKGILPRRKRGRASVVPALGDIHGSAHNTYNTINANMTVRNDNKPNIRVKSPPNESTFCFPNYKLPDIKQEII